ncbi:polymerase complex protein [Bundibugyo virus]|uniref:Polymerase cofactor VP35 n=1 Tax=Bundibugyo virus TaxID=565995 RepID=B8XCM8_9MONO|nr:polymerase complex protein [Bundibugyo ebolavirus]ACI28621.1 VP35 [Bundibugyo ebolavirus]AKB09561.1 polymerase cofactor VP35 [Bundibugyo ebolavirus]ALT19768.1 polymerase cofactor VP35 [Bundibugyo ebolavirus]AYI50305.1 polymerase complex protein [Bundibugyo ebolavirus]AYI50314.1 polymerase complex protein [Bundibugyo ebolavirus]
MTSNRARVTYNPPPTTTGTRSCGPELSGWISEQLMTGKIPITDIFNEIETLPSISPSIHSKIKTPSVQTRSVQTQTDPNCNHDFAEVVKMLTSLTLVVQKQTLATESLEQRITDLEGSLKPVSEITKIVSALNRSCAEMVAKYDLLVMTTGRATATAAATEAYWAEHGRPPPGPSLYEEDAIRTKIGKQGDMVPKEVQEAFRNLDSTALLTEENFGKPDISAKDLRNIMYDHLPGFGTAFHQLVQVICKLGKDNSSLDVIHAEFQASLAEGDSPQCALIQITKRIPIFQDAAPPVIHIRSRGDIPKACQKSLRPVPPSPKIDRGWVCIFQLQDGKTLGLKI